MVNLARQIRMQSRVWYYQYVWPYGWLVRAVVWYRHFIRWTGKVRHHADLKEQGY